MIATPEERFWAKVREGDGDNCSEWTASLKGFGYGQIKIGNKTVSAHRFAWEIHNGPIPEGMHVLHTCDNKRCVKIEHLKLGTDQVNAEDRMRSGLARGARGEAAGRVKLTEREVLVIQEMPGSNRKIAELVGISKTHVGYIKQGKTWRHLLPSTL